MNKFLYMSRSYREKLLLFMKRSLLNFFWEFTREKKTVFTPGIILESRVETNFEGKRWFCCTFITLYVTEIWMFSILVSYYVSSNLKKKFDFEVSYEVFFSAFS